MALLECLEMGKEKLLAPYLIVIILSSVTGGIESSTEDPLWSLKRYFEQITSNTSTPDSISNATSLNHKHEAKFYVGVFSEKFGPRDQYMAHCESVDDCDAGIRMICKNNRCTCRFGELFFEWPKFGCFVKALMFEKCEVSGQCMAMNPNTYCNPENGRCTCSPNYFFNGQECSLRYDTTNLKAQEVYKAAVVAAACFIVAVVGIFVACIVRRSFCRREQQLQQSESNRGSDIFSIDIEALRAVDKPPSYEEVLQIERTFYGIPPPEYSGPRSDTLASSSPVSAVNCSVASDSANLSVNAECGSSVVATTSRSSCNSEDFKESTADFTNLGESSVSNTHLPTSNASDFVTAAEVLPVPSDMENASPLLSGAPTHSAHIFYLSSTPPPRLHRNHVKLEQGSSSLPSSPHLSTVSSRIKNTVIDLHTISRKELLKQDSVTSQPETSHLSQDSCSSLSETSNLSIPLELGTNDSASGYGHSMTVIAYDNLGFESDLYL